MIPPAARPPGRKLPADLKRLNEKAQRNQATLATHFNHLVESDKPLTSRRPYFPEKRREMWRNKRKYGSDSDKRDIHYLLRMPKGSPEGGRFAKQLSKEERAEMLCSPYSGHGYS